MTTFLVIFVTFIHYLCLVLTIAIFIRAILSWFAVSPNNKLVVILYEITDPILSPLRRIIPPVGGFDFTPLIAIILLQVIDYLVRLLLLI